MLGGSLQRTAALVFGIVFLLVGVLGFIPPLNSGNLLLSLFAVNWPHNIVHLLFGVLGVAAATTGAWSLLYIRVTGIVYLLVAALGFIGILTFNGMLLGLVMVNPADNFLHLAIAIVTLILGFIPQFSRSTVVAS